MTKLELKVREILYRDWNPCGVEGLPEHEYDTYVRWVAQSVLERDPNIAFFLDLLQDGYFCGLGKSPEVLEVIAAKLLSLNP